MVVFSSSGVPIPYELDHGYIFIGPLALNVGVAVAPVEWGYAGRGFKGVLKES